MAKSINKKLKEIVTKKLEAAESGKEQFEIPTTRERPRTVTVYKLKYHNRARLDHTKYPNEHYRPVDDSPMFATWDEAYNYCRRLEKQDTENLYFPHPLIIPVTEVDAKLMVSLKKRGWGFHSN